MKTTIITLVLNAVLSLHAQNTKGVSVAYSSSQEPTGKTYALIVGISKYKNPAIPSLQFADRDALAFRNYLVASGVDSNNITLLLNEKASYAETMLSLDELCTQKAKAGDKVFIYFSGHGDVESRVITNVGYLLPYDAPKVVYAISAINVRTLQDYVSTLSANGVQAIVITDACHSGNLAGGLEGMKNIQTVLGDKWKDEIKMLSCQPGELSIEGKQWGNGRGLFSYELINGMAGKADRNNDETISLRELNLHLTEKVPEKAYPNQQNPIVNGNMTLTISETNQQLLAILAPDEDEFSPVDIKGFEEDLLKKMNDTIVRNYRLFQAYLDSNILARVPPEPSAYLYFNRVPENESTKTLRSLMKRNYGAALMNNINVALSGLLDNRMDWNRVEEVSYEGAVVRAVLGDEKLNSLGFLAKAICSEAVSGWWSDSRQEINFAIRQLDTCVAIDPAAVYVYLLRGELYAYRKRDRKKAIEDEMKAIELAPNFIYPYFSLGIIYYYSKMYDSSIAFYQQALQIDSLSSQAYAGIIQAYNKKDYRDSIEYYFSKLLNLPINPVDTALLVDHYGYIAECFDELKDYRQAVVYYKKIIDIAPDNDYGLFCLASDFSLLGDNPSALKYLELVLNAWMPYYSNEKVKISDYKWLMKNTYLKKLRSTPEFKALMKKYFPKEYKE